MCAHIGGAPHRYPMIENNQFRTRGGFNKNAGSAIFWLRIAADDSNHVMDHIALPEYTTEILNVRILGAGVQDYGETVLAIYIGDTGSCCDLSSRPSHNSLW